MEVTLELDGVPEWDGAVDQITAAVRLANREAVGRCLDELDRTMKDTLSRYSHPEGTRTPSPRGEPPALVTGNLRRSASSNGPVQESEDVVTGSMGPTARYAAAQEFGATIIARNYPQLGNPRVGFFGKEVRLPVRPFVEPSVRQSLPELTHIFREEISKALGLR